MGLLQSFHRTKIGRKIKWKIARKKVMQRRKQDASALDKNMETLITENEQAKKTGNPDNMRNVLALAELTHKSFLALKRTHRKNPKMIELYDKAVPEILQIKRIASERLKKIAELKRSEKFREN